MPVGFAGTSQTNLAMDTMIVSAQFTCASFVKFCLISLVQSPRSMPYATEPSFGSSQQGVYGHVSEHGEHMHGQGGMGYPINSPYQSEYPQRI